MSVHYLARDSTIAHEIEECVAKAMHFGTRVRTTCLRCGEVLKPPGSWRSGVVLWEGVTMCGTEKAKEAGA